MVLVFFSLKIWTFLIEQELDCGITAKVPGSKILQVGVNAEILRISGVASWHKYWQITKVLSDTDTFFYELYYTNG